jgi:uncharacterized protein YggT (Ycf19 family)
VRVELAIEVYLLIVALDVMLAWITPDARRWPRRVTHLLTEPVQAAIRPAVSWIPSGGWDLSPLIVAGLLGAARVLWLLP